MPPYAYAILIAGWLTWLAPFLIAKRTRAPAGAVDRRARWGIMLEGVAYALLWQGKFWERPPAAWRLATSLAFFLLAAVLSWSATPALGRHWRVEAALSADHELVTTGPYGVVRHPIYASMLGVLLATGFMITPWWLFAPSLLVFIVGTEIRVRIEDRLLESRFAERFREYQRRVSAYIPGIR